MLAERANTTSQCGCLYAEVLLTHCLVTLTLIWVSCGVRHSLNVWSYLAGSVALTYCVRSQSTAC